MNTTFYIFARVSFRDKLSLFWAILFPLGLMIALGIAFPQASYRLQLLGGVLAMSTFFATLWTVAFESVMLRSQGVYKLLRLTPFRIAKFILSFAASKSLAALLSSLVVLAIGFALWDLAVPIASLGLLLLALVVGTLCFLMLGFLVGNFAREVTQVSLLLNLVGMPMLFLSEAFYSLERAPAWLNFVSRLLPFERFVQSLQSALQGDVLATLMHSLIVAAFGLVFLTATVLTWRWQ